MNAEHAEHTLETIRALMERSQRYQHISGYSGLVAGGCVLAGCGVLWSGALPWSHSLNFTVVWSLVFAVAFTAHCLLTFARARQRGEAVWSRQARTVTWAVLPGFAASVILTVTLARGGMMDILPGVWLVLYGCSALATSFFAPYSLRWLGLICLAAGGISLIIAPDHPVLTMFVGFGLTHVIYGAGVAIIEHRRERFARELAELMSGEEPA